MAKRSKLLVCVDATEHSKTAFKFALAKAQDINYPIEVLHIVDPKNFTGIMGVGEKMRTEKLEQGQKLLDGFAKQAARYNIVPSLNLKEGELSDTIIKVVEDDDSVNMVILGKCADAKEGDDISLLTSALTGNIDVPILIVPGNLSDKKIKELTA